jgi:hypothetical protein
MPAAPPVVSLLPLASAVLSGTAAWLLEVVVIVDDEEEVVAMIKEVVAAPDKVVIAEFVSNFPVNVLVIALNCS